MNIYVCVKQVPDTEAQIVVKDGKSIDEGGIKWIVNPYDEYAVEEALKLKDAGGGEAVVVVTLGAARAQAALRTALAMGADRALHIETDEVLGCGEVAAALAGAIKADGEFQVVFTGTMAIDDYASQVHLRLAHALSASAATTVVGFAVKDAGFEVTSEVGGGGKEVVALTAPAVVAVTKGINTPRYPTLPNIMKAKKKEIKKLTLAEVGVTTLAGAEEVISLVAPEAFTGGEVLTGDASSTVPMLVDRLQNEAKVV